MDISFCGIGNLSEVLGTGKYTNLIKLNVFGNDLLFLPEFTGGLFENLKILHVNINKISSVPKSIVELTNLDTLSLKTNNLQTLPKTMIPLLIYYN